MGLAIVQTKTHEHTTHFTENINEISNVLLRKYNCSLEHCEIGEMIAPFDCSICAYALHCLLLLYNTVHRPLSRRLDRCDRVIQDEVGDSIRGNV